MRSLDYKKLSLDIEGWISEYVSSAGARSVVLGLSGGIDSAVTAALCRNALGKENVLSYGLPCNSIAQDLTDAKLIASQLGINFYIYSLDSVFNQVCSITEIDSNPIARANLKARLRMATLYFIAQSMENCLIVGTGNRAELQIGYFTKYGDGGVDFEPLGMLYKSEVKKIAELLDIPKKIIRKAPSPGLWSGQTDEGEIGMSYDTVDEILYRLDYNLNLNGLDEEKVIKIKQMMKSAEHKLKPPPAFQV